MKLPFQIYDLRFAISKKSSSSSAAHGKSPVVNQKSRQGIALIITLILLSVTLVMAVAFLAVARRERNAVTTTTDTTTARLAAEAALAGASAQIVANIFSSPTNINNDNFLGAYNFTLLVSTNYQNSYGFNSAAGAYPTNVNYDYLAGGGAVTGGNLEQNIANLLLLPRAPVYVYNRTTGSNDFRFYLDLNRNGRFETNGFITTFDNNNNILTNETHIGDPEWIGVLERPDQPHGPNNHFIARYAFLAQPIGNALDLNSMHNFSKRLGAATMPAGSDSFYRNQGVGSWEINLGAFLADLNTNQWFNYNYALNAATGLSDPSVFNSGNAFDDAVALLRYRYNYNYNNLAAASFSLSNAPNVFPYDNIDGYSDGPLQISTTNINESLSAASDGDRNSGTISWAGANNPNRFFTLPSDLFDPAKSSVAFTGRLLSTGNSNSTYDRYTFYRMLDELGTDSSADTSKLNLNYSNAVVQYDNNSVVTNIAIVVGAETNLVPWAAINFFNAAANHLLHYQTAQWRAQNFTDYTNTFGAVTTAEFGLTNIPVYIDNRFVYSPAVNRLLQLAANIYDASTNSIYPSVFRPIFHRYANGDVYINGFSEVTSVSGIGDAKLVAPLDVTALPLNATTINDNIYGVPWIIGAKKGLPNFNQFYSRSTVQVTRKLQVKRNDGLVPGATGTNQMFVMSITNRLGFSFWNSYESNYVSSSSINVYVRDIISMGMTNGTGAYPLFPPASYGNSALFQFATNFNFTTWPGSAWAGSGSAPDSQTAAPESFVSGAWDFAFLPEADFQNTLNQFVASGTGVPDATSPTPVFPQFGLLTTNRLQAFILDGPHVIDYVQLAGPNGARNISDEIQDKTSNPTDNTQIINGTAMWVTNGSSGAAAPTKGVMNQITVSQNGPAGSITALWKHPPNMPPALNTPTLEAAYFKAFFYGGTVSYNNKTYANTNLVIQAPYTPTRSAWEYTAWQANDPLVHYLASDLNTILTKPSATGIHHSDNLANSSYPNPSLNAVADRYQPWGRNQQISQAANVDSGKYNLRYRDPLVWGSDYWDFPTGKYPSVGWLGRVHRGTPWQTIYLKARDVLEETQTFGNTELNVGTNTWAQWTGDTQTTFGRNFDAVNSAPVRDSDLFDLFTTRFNDNAARGALSVNQTHLAAWSAVFSGVVGLTNITDLPTSYTLPVTTNFIVQPAGSAGNTSPLGLLVNGSDGINTTRSTFTNADGLVGTFEHVGDILRVPAYSERSPFLNWSDSAQQQYGISDKLYEWLPEQTLGLLHVSSTPRYVVYCYGQTLRPAADGLVSSGTFFGLITNYQVTAESAARAVIRVDKIPSGTNYTYRTTVGKF